MKADGVKEINGISGKARQRSPSPENVNDYTSDYTMSKFNQSIRDHNNQT